MIDLANTVGTPSLARRRATADAPAGLDPPASALERRTAERLGKKGAVHMVSAAMTNRVRAAT